MSTKKWRKLVSDLAAEHGLVLVTSGGKLGHWKITRPTGETIVTCAATPKDEHVIHYIAKDIRRSLREGPAHTREGQAPCR